MCVFIRLSKERVTALYSGEEVISHIDFESGGCRSKGQRLYVGDGRRERRSRREREQKWPRPTLPVVRLEYSRRLSTTRISAFDTRATLAIARRHGFALEPIRSPRLRLISLESFPDSASVRRIERHNLSPDNRPSGVARVTLRQQWQWTRILTSPSSAGSVPSRVTISCRYLTRRASNGSCRLKYAPAFPLWYVESKVSANILLLPWSNCCFRSWTKRWTKFIRNR